jgi:thiol-disulfide isomerase/thioredoxin
MRISSKKLPGILLGTLLMVLSSLLLTSCDKKWGPVALSEKSEVEDFKGHPSLIVFAGTYCPHCQAFVPEIKEKIHAVYSSQLNVWINVVDKQKFEVKDMYQGFNPKLTYEGFAKEECKYIPSWVILDKNGEVLTKSCGSDKSFPEMLDAIKSAVTGVPVKAPEVKAATEAPKVETKVEAVQDAPKK